MKQSFFFRSLLFYSPLLLLFNLSINAQQSTEPVIKVHYLGHSSFVLQFDNGVTVVTDYGHENAWVDYGWDSPINNMGNLVPDIITFSHMHDDHYDEERIPEGVKHILTGTDSLTIEGIDIIPFRTSEDSVGLKSNTSYLFSYKGFKICHIADAQAEIMNISQAEVQQFIKSAFPDKLDLLFMTIEGKEKFIPEAEAFIDFLQPRIVIPMHYWTEQYKSDFLNHLRKENDSGKMYEILEVDSPDYEFTFSEKIDSIKIITLTRAPFK